MSDVDVLLWRKELDQLFEWVGQRFVRAEPRERMARYVDGLLAGLERKNGWTLAEHAREISPDGMQRLLRTADWDVDAVRDDVRDYLVEHIGSRQAVLVIDESGFIKKGTHSAGVQRQYTGTSGKRDNCQVGVFAAYVTDEGHALLDRELYIPESWTADPDRCRAAGIPQPLELTTKPRMAISMLQRILDADVPFAWFTADEVYGQVKYLRVWLEEHDIHHVVATRRDEDVFAPDYGYARADEVLAALPARAWRRLSCGAGAHGPRVYDWARVGIRIGWRAGRGHWLLARRSVDDPSEIAYYICYGPRRSSLAGLARIAGSRWPVEECFQQAKNETGLDDYQVRTWRGWYAHITLSMLALAWLAVMRAQAKKGAASLTRS
jgi:SRSO17 transposase